MTVEKKASKIQKSYFGNFIELYFKNLDFKDAAKLGEESTVPKSVVEYSLDKHLSTVIAQQQHRPKMDDESLLADAPALPSISPSELEERIIENELAAVVPTHGHQYLHHHVSSSSFSSSAAAAAAIEYELNSWNLQLNNTLNKIMESAAAAAAASTPSTNPVIVGIGTKRTLSPITDTSEEESNEINGK